jgi:hypothetical protein
MWPGPPPFQITGGLDRTNAEFAARDAWHFGCSYIVAMSTLRFAPLLLSFSVFVACSQEAPSKKPLPVCDEGSDGCSKVARAEKQPSASQGPSGDPVTPSTQDLKEADAGLATDAAANADAAADAALGELCTDLSACCDQIEAAGYVPDNCRSVVALKHEGACYAQHEQYKNAGDCS